MLDHPEIATDPAGVIFILKMKIYVLCLVKVLFGGVEMTIVHINCTEVAQRLEQIPATLVKTINHTIDFVSLLPHGVSIEHRAFCIARQANLVIEPGQLIGIKRSSFVLNSLDVMSLGIVPEFW